LQAKFLADVFAHDEVETILARVDQMLAQIVAEPERRVGRVDVLVPAEREQLAEFNATEVDVPARTLADMFDAQVARTPDADALVFGGEVLSYAEFDARANRLARHLIGMGVGPESKVAIAMRRSLDLLVGMYGIIKAGAAYVPIDPDHPADRTTYVLQIADPVCVLTTAGDGIEVAEAFDVVEIDTLELSELSADPVTDADRTAPLRPHNTAYVMFTSGSTGKPKGVVVTHRAIVNQLVWKQSEYRLGPDDVVLQQIAMTFDVSVWEFFWGLQNGATLVIAKPDGHKDMRYLASLIEQYGITTATFVPSPLGVFVAEADPSALRTLRHAFVIGEALPPETAERFRELCSASLNNMYGPTEAAVSVTNWQVGPEDTQTVPIGVPQWNVTAHVLDSGLRPTPAGVAGELYLGGAQLARGYLQRPGITCDRFVADPFGRPGERMYRTGDLVRRRPDGALEYIGRTDFQVKLRGQRIELEEIESAVLAHQPVRQAAVLVHKDPQTGDHLIAYVIAHRGADLDTGQLRAFVGHTLPKYMVPDAVVVLDEFPLNPSGKLDRKQLPLPEFHRTGEYVAPATETERIVADVLAEVLGLERVSADASFFELGGNSLSATRLVSRLTDALGTPMSLRAIFLDPTVTGIAASAESGDGSSAGVFDVMLPIREQGADNPVFCIHPVLGLSWAYRGLADALDAAIPIYGVQSPAATGPWHPESVEEIATRYVDEIRAIRPDGPYRLLGWSLGGVIAHAVAARLQEQGEQIEMLVMFDSFPGESAKALGEEGVAPSEIVAGLGLPAEMGVDPVLDSPAIVAAKLREAGGPAFSDVTAEWLENMIATATESMTLMRRYEPRTIDADLLLFTAGSGRDDDTVAPRAWRGAVSGDVVHHSIDATHWAMMSADALTQAGPMLAEFLTHRSSSVDR